MKIGFIGVGVMGNGMVKNLFKAWLCSQRLHAHTRKSA